MGELRRSIDDASCPYCGSESGVILYERAYLERAIGWDGTSINAAFNTYAKTPPKSARCVSCKRIVANPMISLAARPDTGDDE